MLCAALCACTLMSSFELCAKRLKSARAVAELAEAVERITALLRFESADVYEICRRAFEGFEAVDLTAFSKIESGDFGAQWEKACEALEADAEAKRLFARVGRVLGTCDAESQEAVLSGISRELYERSRAMKDSAEKSKRLYLTFGAAAGLGISVIVL